MAKRINQPRTAFSHCAMCGEPLSAFERNRRRHYCLTCNPQKPMMKRADTCPGCPHYEACKVDVFRVTEELPCYVVLPCFKGEIEEMKESLK